MNDSLQKNPVRICVHQIPARVQIVDTKDGLQVNECYLAVDGTHVYFTLTKQQQQQLFAAL